MQQHNVASSFFCRCQATVDDKYVTPFVVCHPFAAVVITSALFFCVKAWRIAWMPLPLLQQLKNISQINNKARPRIFPQ